MKHPDESIRLLGTWWVFAVFLSASITCTLLEWGRWTFETQLIWVTPIISLFARWYLRKSNRSEKQ